MSPARFGLFPHRLGSSSAASHADGGASRGAPRAHARRGPRVATPPAGEAGVFSTSRELEEAQPAQARPRDRTRRRLRGRLCDPSLSANPPPTPPRLLRVSISRRPGSSAWGQCGERWGAAAADAPAAAAEATEARRCERPSAQSRCFERLRASQEVSDCARPRSRTCRSGSRPRQPPSLPSVVIPCSGADVALRAHAGFAAAAEIMPRFWGREGRGWPLRTPVGCGRPRRRPGLQLTLLRVAALSATHGWSSLHESQPLSMANIGVLLTTGTHPGLPLEIHASGVGT